MFEVPLDIFRSSFDYFTVLMYDDWVQTSIEPRMSGPSGDNYFNIQNDET